MSSSAGFVELNVGAGVVAGFARIGAGVEPGAGVATGLGCSCLGENISSTDLSLCFEPLVAGAGCSVLGTISICFAGCS